ncbi:metallophosphoesterase family protein [Paenibacillus beijingensis]|uniref:Calcineurin-like phosphoesterase domain-containing protein n=1 Tax=Paenibacillus beijingensis TaxID=1126833 RepID=A0A0D5NJA3_9BACL|nr:metallophosphoesterase [Paenibacillus beijingensis]AJY75165.1 hypothetical protein VN24_11970 [Paenibacillus beijingensis]
MKLMVMGDFHYSCMAEGTEEMRAARDYAYSRMLAGFFQHEADYYISLGDFTNEGVPEEFEDLYARIGNHGGRFVHVLGNHDTYSIPKADILAITGQKRYHAINTPDAMLIFLDTTKEMNKEDWGGEIDGVQLEWLREMLRQSGEKPAFVFAHHPVYDTTARSTIDKLSVHPSIDLKSVLNTKQGEGFYFCGHNHTHSIVRQDRWHYVQTAACLDIPAFRTVEMQDGQVRIGLLPIEEDLLTDHISRFHKKMRGFQPFPEALGTETDWSLTVDLLKPAQ